MQVTVYENLAELNKERNLQSAPRGRLTMKSKCWLNHGLLGIGVVWCSASFSRLACTTRRRFRAQANGWIDAENPRLARPLHRLSKARNSVRLVLGRSHLWSSRMALE